jgi:hypothetical protein
VSVEQPQAVPIARVARPPAPQTPETPFYALLLLILIACLLGVLVYTSVTGAERWEYSVVSLADTELKKEMNEMGREGWELVTARRTSGGSYEMVFKRRGRAR